MTPKTLNLHVSKHLNISKTKQDIEKLKTPLIRLVWKCSSDAPEVGPTIFRRSCTLKERVKRCLKTTLTHAKNRALE